MGQHNLQLEEDNERLRRGLLKDTLAAAKRNANTNANTNANAKALAGEVTRLRRELVVMTKERHTAQLEANLVDQLKEENEQLKRDMAAAEHLRKTMQTDATELRAQAELSDRYKKENERFQREQAQALALAKETSKIEQTVQTDFQREMALLVEHMNTLQTELEDLRPKAALVDRLSDSNDKLTEIMKEQTQKLKTATSVVTHLTEENKRLQRETAVALDKMTGAHTKLVRFKIYNNNLAGQLQQSNANLLESERARSALLIQAQQGALAKGNENHGQLVVELQGTLATVHQTNQNLLQKVQASDAAIHAQKLEIARLQKQLIDAAAPIPVQANDQARMKVEEAELARVNAEASLRTCRREIQRQKLGCQHLTAENMRMQATERRHSKEMKTLGGTNTELGNRLEHLSVLANQRGQQILALEHKLQESRSSMPGTGVWTAPAPRGPTNPSPEHLEIESLRTQITALEALCGEQQSQIEVLLGENEDFKTQLALLEARMDRIQQGRVCERCATDFETQVKVKELKEESTEEQQGQALYFEPEMNLLEGAWDRGGLADANG
ncbi:hypothetical protein YB2330_001246 [Saitoella coloradoensis]